MVGVPGEAYLHRDPESHLALINNHLRRLRVKIRVKQCRSNTLVQYRMTHVGLTGGEEVDPRSEPMFQVHTLFKHQRPDARCLLLLYIRVHDMVQQPVFHDASRQCLVALSGRTLWVLSMGEGIEYDRVEWLAKLPQHTDSALN